MTTAQSTRTPATCGELLFLASAASLLFLFPMSAGLGVVHSLAWGLFAIAFVFLPGFALLAWTDRVRDWIASTFLAFVAGLACLTFVLLAASVLDARSYVWLLPILGAIAWYFAPRRANAGPRPTTTILEACCALVTIAVALARVEVEIQSEWFRGFESDASFHVENAIEWTRHWPMRDPRIAGESLRYHFFSYAPASAASVVIGLPVRECMLGLGAHLGPMMFALGMFAAARALKSGVVAATIVSLALVTHVDLGTHIGDVFGVSTSFDSNFDVGLYRSITTVQGLCVLVALSMVLVDLLAGATRARAHFILLALFAALASGSKGSVLPPLLLAVAFAWVVQPTKRVDCARGLSVMVLAALPFTLWLTLDPDGYASNMFQWHPAAAQVMSPFQAAAVEALGGDPSRPNAWLTVALFVPWCLGYLGLGALALGTWFATRARPFSAIESVLGATVVFGLASASMLVAQGQSQMFFAYDAQVCALLLGAIATTRIRGMQARVLAGAAGLVLAVQIGSIVWKESTERTLRVEFVGDKERYRRALDWIRDQTPTDALFLIDDPRLSVTTWTERRAFFETQRFSPRLHAHFDVDGGRAKSIQVRPFPKHERLQSAFFASPTPEIVSEIRELSGADVPLFALRSNLVVTPRPQSYACEFKVVEDAASFGRESNLVLVHDEGIVAIYRIED